MVSERVLARRWASEKDGEHSQDGDIVATVGLGLHVPAGLCKAGGVTPRVIVEGEEISTGLRPIATAEVLELLLDVLGDIGRGVTNRHGA